MERLEGLTSGRCCRTGTFCASRVSRTAFILVEGLVVRIVCLASSSHAFMRVILASSPCPKRAEVAVSDKGPACGVGRCNTEFDRASRVKPCVFTSGRASCNKRDLQAFSTLNVSSQKHFCNMLTSTCRSRYEISTSAVQPTSAKVSSGTRQALSGLVD